MDSCIATATAGCTIVHAEYPMDVLHAEYSILGPVMGIFAWPTCRERLVILAGVKAPRMSQPMRTAFSTGCVAKIRC